MIRRSHRNNHHMVLDNGTSCMWEFEALGSPIFLLHTVGPFAFHFRIRAVMFHSLLVISHFLVFLLRLTMTSLLKPIHPYWLTLFVGNTAHLVLLVLTVIL